MANDNGHTSNDPFKQYKITEIVYGTPIYITTDERKQLAEADMGDDKQLETQRDIFVFQCMIGCRVSDLYKMTMPISSAIASNTFPARRATIGW